jgi:hypothetical protein
LLACSSFSCLAGAIALTSALPRERWHAQPLLWLRVLASPWLAFPSRNAIALRGGLPSARSATAVFQLSRWGLSACHVLSRKAIALRMALASSLRVKVPRWVPFAAEVAGLLLFFLPGGD